MKKVIYLTILLAVGVTAVSAQKLVPRAGLTIASNTGEPQEDVSGKSITGFTVGLGYNIAINETFSIQPELNFIQKGSKYEGSGEIEDGEEIYDFDASMKATINYLEVPVLARASFGSDKAKFFVQAGPSVAFGLGGKSKYSFKASYDGEEVFSETSSGKVKFGDSDDEESDDHYVDNRLDLGFQLGAGVTLNEKISLDIRYGLGLSDLYDEAASKNRAIQFTVAVPLALK